VAGRVFRDIRFPMTDLDKRAVEALERMPADMREKAVAFLEEQADKLRVLRALVQEGIDDMESGRVSEFDMNEIRALAQQMTEKH
jgi:hypothetical protein